MKKFLKQKYRKIIKSGFLFIVLFSLLACVPKIDPRWNQIEQARVVTPQIKDKVCELIKKRTGELQSLRTLSDLRLNLDGSNQSLRLSLVFQTPNKVRFEVLPPAAALSLFIASSNEAQTLLLEPTKKKATTVSDPQDLMSRLLKIRLLPQDLVYILSARIPPRHLDRICASSVSASEDKRVEFYYSTDGPGVTIFDSKTGQYWTVSMGSGLLRTALLRRVSDDWPVLSADYEEDDFEDPNQLYPRRIDLVLGNEALFATLEANIVKVNTTIPLNLFDIKVPAGYVIEEK